MYGIKENLLTFFFNVEENDAPRYRRGNKINISLQVVTVFLFLFQRTKYKLTNAWRNHTWNKMSDYEKAVYLQDTKDKGNNRLDFRYRT